MEQDIWLKDLSKVLIILKSGPVKFLKTLIKNQILVDDLLKLILKRNKIIIIIKYIIGPKNIVLDNHI